MSAKVALDELIRRACRRDLINLILAQAALAATIAMGGVIVLLLVGTQILDWPWLLALFLGSVFFGIYRTLRRVSSPYVVTQRMDRRLNFGDTVSTAFFFRRFSHRRPVSADMYGAQQNQAEQLCGQVDMKRALSLAIPRTLRATAALGLVVIGLLAFRYGLSRPLDLRPPIARPVFDFFRQPAIERAAVRNSRRPRRSPELSRTAGLTPDQSDAANTTWSDSVADSNMNSADASDVSDESSARYRSGGQEDVSQAEAFGESPQPQDDNASSGQPEAPDGMPPLPSSEAKRSAPDNGQDSNLINKLRDAMADLLSRLKLEPNFGGSQQTTAGSQGGLQSKRQRQTLRQAGAPGPGRRRLDNFGDAEQQAEGEGSDSSQSGRRGQTASDGRASQEERSGAGKGEGSKELREGEQTAAMGKISEIIGKRSANVKGEVTVEVSSGRQQRLKTPYSQTRAVHSESGGEIHRDEVPLIYQHYVQQYFEKVRGVPPPKPVSP
jgi:hypothetical protein